MFRLAIYMLLAYLVTGLFLYIQGHPGTERNALSPKIKTKRGWLYRQAAHSAQTANFLIHRLRPRRLIHNERSFREIYGDSVKRAFDPAKHQFVTTGSPHSRACYPRNFAWFYPNLLDRNTIISERDFDDRVNLIRKSLRMIIEKTGPDNYSTTLVPLGFNLMAKVDYTKPPSDSLMGVLSGLEQLGNHGTDLVSEYKNILVAQIGIFLSGLRVFKHAGREYLLLDSDRDKSTSTDTRHERRRFVVNANVWTTVKKSAGLGLLSDKEIIEMLKGRDLAGYKQELLELFGSEGYIRNSLDYSGNPAGNIVLDFAHTYGGFWDLSDPDSSETKLFRLTADLILSDPQFRDKSGQCFFVSRRNPKNDLIHFLSAKSYHGRSVWPAFNVEFSDRLLDLAESAKETGYAKQALATLNRIKIYIEKCGGYPELLDMDGNPYRTWVYKNALADSWFPRFLSVMTKAENQNGGNLTR